LLYGDGLFETLRVREGRPLWWSRHLARLAQGAMFLRLTLPHSPAELRAAAGELIRVNELSDAVLRILLTRGSGARGYSAVKATSPTVAMTLHPVTAGPAAVRLITSRHRVSPSDPLIGYKTANKLLAVLARMEAEDAGVDETLLLNTDGYLAEAAAGNIFWIEAGVVCTPRLSSGALNGVMRSVVLEACRERGWRTKEKRAKPGVLYEADGAFLTNSVVGLLPISALDGRPVRSSDWIGRLQQAVNEKGASESRGEPPFSGG
jgi:aminodeoxychorismate lyase